MGKKPSKCVSLQYYKNLAVFAVFAVFGICVLYSLFAENQYEYSGATISYQDIGVLRSAINLHDQHNRPLTGTSPLPLVGRYLQELFKDPWGNDYLLDTSVGFISSYGMDQKPGGADEARDRVAYYKSHVCIHSVMYSGPWGKPKNGSHFIILLTGPVNIVSHSDVLKGIVFKDSQETWLEGKFASFADLNNRFGHKWVAEIANPKSFTSDEQARGALLVMNKCEIKSDLFLFKKGTEVAFRHSEIKKLKDQSKYIGRMLVSSKYRGEPSVYGLRESPLPGGPLDKELYGTGVQMYLRSPVNRLKKNGQIAEDIIWFVARIHSDGS